jgi:hypothetical protein
MTSRFSTRLALLAGLAGLSAPALAQDIALTVELPDEIDWTLVDEKVVGQAYSREWLPSGRQWETAEWLITNQKVPLDRDESADDFLEDIYDGLAAACTSAEHENIERIRLDGLRGAAGRTMCARRKGEEFGTFSDQAVFIENGFAFVITSELRIQPMVVAGVVAFDLGDRDASREARLDFMDRELMSRELVREGIRVAD